MRLLMLMELDSPRHKWGHQIITTTARANITPHRIIHLRVMQLVEQLQERITKNEILDRLGRCQELKMKVGNHVVTADPAGRLVQEPLAPLQVDQDTTKNIVALGTTLLKMRLHRHQEEQPMFPMQVLPQE